MTSKTIGDGMQLEVLPAEQIVGVEREKLRTLTFREESGLRIALRRWGADPRAKVLRITDDDGTVLSWGLMVPEKHIAGKDWYLQLYTRASHRQRGLGKTIYKRAARIAHGKDKLHVYPHDYTSRKFFDKVTGK